MHIDIYIEVTIIFFLEKGTSFYQKSFLEEKIPFCKEKNTVLVEEPRISSDQS